MNRRNNAHGTTVFRISAWRGILRAAAENRGLPTAARLALHRHPAMVCAEGVAVAKIGSQESALAPPGTAPRLLLVASLLVVALFCIKSLLPALPCRSEAPGAVVAAKPHRTQAIDTVRVGQRVLSWNPNSACGPRNGETTVDATRGAICRLRGGPRANRRGRQRGSGNASTAGVGSRARGDPRCQRTYPARFGRNGPAGGIAGNSA